MNLELTDKTALVTAASRGLGFALAQELLAEGANVMICGRTQARLDGAVARLRETTGAGDRVAALVADVAEPAAAGRLVEETAAHFGGLDILVTNAGGSPGGTFENTELSAWERGLELTLMSVVRLVKAALPPLRRSRAASILTVTSFSVKQPVPGLLLSNVIRPSVAALTKSLARELGPEGIRANSILPGWTATERVEEILAWRAEQNDSDPAHEADRITATIPLRRMAAPAEFARAAAFLVSPAASYITGELLLVDGGAYTGPV